MGDHNRKSSYSKEDQTTKISKTVFLTNFLDHVRARDLWNVFNKYGSVVDVYIPFKKSKAGKRFGFIRFIKAYKVRYQRDHKRKPSFTNNHVGVTRPDNSRGSSVNDMNIGKTKDAWTLKFLGDNLESSSSDDESTNNDEGRNYEEKEHENINEDNEVDRVSKSSSMREHISKNHYEETSQSKEPFNIYNSRGSSVNDMNIGKTKGSFASILKEGPHKQSVPEHQKQSVALVLDDSCLTERDFSLSLMGKVKESNASDPTFPPGFTPDITKNDMAKDADVPRRVVPRHYDPKGARFLIASRFPTPPFAYNGFDTSFWEDTWRGHSDFKTAYPRIYALESHKNINVAEKMSHDNLGDSLRGTPRGGIEHDQFIKMLASVEGTVLVEMHDRWVWSKEGSCVFLVASARRLIDDCWSPNVPTKTLWINVVPIKTNVHAWK
nr:RNA-directed DNA polymerase, eukaryota, reverse transcriptase zinc-binding domain protein [Tanacetum cinerariifolium]